MPFAMLGAFLALFINELEFDWRRLILVVLCMVFARNAAMAFNRWLDRDIDNLNPRTSSREIPAGVISSSSALIFVVINCILFILSCFFINKICFLLSPLALLIVLGYSYTKRFTALCHLVLGLGLALAPVGAYLAMAGIFHLIPILHGVAVLFWVAGFDIIYALQDEEFDEKNDLSSIPVSLGTSRALILARVFHFLSVVALSYASYLLYLDYTGIGIISFIALLIFILLLMFQHTLVKPNDLTKVNLAFFTTNGFASLIFGLMVILDFYF